MGPVTLSELESLARDGHSAANDALRVRQGLRWQAKKGDPGRERAIETALKRLNEASAPLRSAIGRLAYEPQPDQLDAELRSASQRIQYERRQLKKMLRASGSPGGTRTHSR